jgi:hypothetical protein
MVPEVVICSKVQSANSTIDTPFRRVKVTALDIIGIWFMHRLLPLLLPHPKPL